MTMHNVTLKKPLAIAIASASLGIAGIAGADTLSLEERL